MVMTCILLISCNSLFEPEVFHVTLCIQGIVTDAVTGLPISNVRVHLGVFSINYTKWDENYYTEEDGRYFFEREVVDCTEGSVSLYLTKSPEYLPSSIGGYGDTSISCSNQIQIFNFQMKLNPRWPELR